jgi:hypothetical protein
MIGGMSRLGDFRRLIVATVILSCIYFPLSSYMHSYFANTRADEWSGGPGVRVKVRYFANPTQRLLFWPALVVESAIVGQKVNSELEK